MRLRNLAIGAVAAGTAVLVLGGCGSSAGPAAPTISAAQTYALQGFELGPRLQAGKPMHVTFAIKQPSGTVLTAYRRGSGPHTGVHLILVRSDLGALVHTHPPIGPSGRVEGTVVLPTPGRYRVVVDAYPGTGLQRNLQLFRWITVPGAVRTQPLPPFKATTTVDGYRFTLHGHPHLRAIQAAFLTVTVTRPDGTPATFTVIALSTSPRASTFTGMPFLTSPLASIAAGSAEPVDAKVFARSSTFTTAHSFRLGF